MNRRIIQLAGVDEVTRSIRILASTKDPVEVTYVDENGQPYNAFEAIESWDLTRFEKNPVMLWSHQSSEFPVATADEFEVGDFGLKMRAVIASKEANPLSEQLYHALKEKLVRAVSVGFAPGTSTWEDRDGKRVNVLRNCNLLEVSFCSVPKDENAGAPSMGTITPDGTPTEPDPAKALSDEEKERKALSEAARKLGKGRKRKGSEAVEQAAEALEQGDYSEQHFDIGPGALTRAFERGAVERTQVGGFRIPARLARTGVLRYRNSDGTYRSEFRPHDEVSRAESLATLEGAPVIDFVDHVDLIRTDDWQGKAIGFVQNVRMDGRYVVGDLVINDRAAIEMIDRGERADTSAGYQSRAELTPGEFDGETYDLIQRGIRYNHVAICPPNRGRSGPEVGLRLDATDGAWCATENEMSDKTKVRLDMKDGTTKELDYGSKEHLDAVDTLHKAEVAVLSKANDSLQARLDASEENVRKAREETENERKRAEEERKRSTEDVEKRAFARAQRLLRARDFLEDEDRSDEEVEEEKRKRKRADEDEEAKATSPEEKEEVRKRRRKRAEEEGDEKKLDALTERELMVRVIRRHSPDFVAEGRSDDYLESRFDAVIEDHSSSRRVHGVVAAAETGRTRLDRSDDDADVVAKARQANIERQRNAHREALKGGK